MDLFNLIYCREYSKRSHCREKLPPNIDDEKGQPTEQESAHNDAKC
jgi:hypothetical protein